MAAKSSGNAAGGRPFVKGQSGNPAGKKPGTRNKATREIKAFALDLFERPKFQKTLKQKWDDLTLDPQYRVLLTYYAFGKPVTALQVGATGDLAKILAGDFEEGVD